MENKLQQLTEKLYNEGLSKGRQEADELLEKARKDASKMIEDAKKEATRIVESAKSDATELAKNTQTEIALASSQALSTIKQSIQNIVVSRVVSPAIKEANQDPNFVKDVILDIAKKWSPDKNIDLQVMLDSNVQKSFLDAVDAGVKQVMSQGIVVKTDAAQSSGFKIGAKDGGFYVSFSDEDFQALLSDYLRPRVYEMLYGKEVK